MANLHKSKAHRQIRDILKFSTAYYLFAVITTVVLALVAYKDIIFLRFRTQFFSGSYEYSTQLGQLFIDGFSANMLQRFFDYLPITALIIFIIIIAYSSAATFDRTFHSLMVHKHYVNATKESAFTISMHYTVIYAASFAVPLLYWCLYLTIWFPQIARLPLKYIVGYSTWQFILVSSLVLFALTLLTQFGLVLTRLAVRVFKA